MKYKLLSAVLKPTEYPGNLKTDYDTIEPSTYKKLQSMGFKWDNPLGNWLLDERNYVSKSGSRKMSSVTAVIRKINLPVDFLITLPGEKGEHLPGKINKMNLEDLEKSMKKKGFLKENPISVSVFWNGYAVISEGNHRVRAAKNVGIKEIPVEVYYCDGGELMEGKLSPEKLVKMIKL